MKHMAQSNLKKPDLVPVRPRVSYLTGDSLSGPDRGTDKITAREVPYQNCLTWPRLMIKHTARLGLFQARPVPDYRLIASRATRSGPSRAVCFILNWGYPIWPRPWPWQNFRTRCPEQKLPYMAYTDDKTHWPIES